VRKPVWIILIVAVAVIAIDQLSKYAVSTTLPLGGTWSPFPGPTPFFQIVYTYNTGVAFGLLKELGPGFFLIPLAVVVIILLYARKLRGDHWLAPAALGLMLGGALGNVMDRIWLGHVIDFIDVGIGSTRWYTSNVADIAIVSGVILLGLATVLDERKVQKEKRGQPAASGAANERSSPN
jgi:signal peptidase II